jgi:hypothetical protein
LRRCRAGVTKSDRSALRPNAEAVANVHDFVLAPREFTTRVGGLFLFVHDLVRLDGDALALGAKLPGSGMIPAGHALRASLALKLWSIERKSHVMALVADEGLALFCGLNAMPKKSFLSEYSSRITPPKARPVAVSVDRRGPVGRRVPQPRLPLSALLRRAPAGRIALSVQTQPPPAQHPHLPGPGRRQPGILLFERRHPQGRGGRGGLRFIAFWKRQYGRLPQHLVFDSKLTTYDGLDRLDAAGITFITLRRRSPSLLAEIDNLPPSAWRTVTLDISSRKHRTPRVYEQKARPHKRDFRQFFITDLGHDEPTILLTNDAKSTPKTIITRYAKRMLIENSDAVRFFHIDALSSSVGLKVDFDMALLVIASGLYRLMAQRMRGYDDAQARQIFRDLIDMPADVVITQSEITVRFHRRAHLPIVLASGLIGKFSSRGGMAARSASSSSGKNAEMLG